MKIKKGQEAEFDVLLLEEYINRLSPLGHQQIECIPVFEVHNGEGENNVTCALARYGMQAHRIAPLKDTVKRPLWLELLLTNLFFWDFGWKALCEVYKQHMSLVGTCISVRLAVN